MEPISPELVLVDPVLARAERARLLEQDRLVSAIDVAALRRAVETHVEPEESARHETPLALDLGGWARARVTQLILTVSLLANGFLLAEVIAGSDDTVLLAAPAPAQSAPDLSRALQAQSADATTKAGVERKILSLLLRSPGRRLPRELIDPVTGLAKNNLQAICRHPKTHGAFLCVVRPAEHAPEEGLYVRYRPQRDGRDAVTWSRYHAGKRIRQ